MRRFWLLFVMMASSVLSFAQNDNSGKYSPSTLMFLSEQRGEVELPKINKGSVPTTIATPPPFGAKELSEMRDFGKRKIAEAETVNGVQMISAFIAVNNNDFSGLEALGVIFQKKFKGLATTLIPVDKIEQVAALSNVTRIEVSEILEPLNDKQRSVTQAYDALTNSSAAQALGLNSAYTGKGVILGVIDTGIDFQHIAFKDKSGNSRIVRAYKLSGSNSTSLTTYSSSSQISALTYDTNTEDHGTHTVSTAGGSSVIVNGSTVTVTDDHSKATYGGMAPEADLVVAGLSSLYTASIATAIGNICDYADQVGKPCVISLSLGSQVGAHDGTGTVASVVNQYAGNNHIIVYAASNDGMRANSFVELGTSNGGGMYASGTSTSSKPMIVNVQRSFSNADGNVEMLMPTICAYARTAGVATSLKFHVVNVKTGAIVYSSSAYTSSTTIDVTGSSGLAQYFKSSSSYSNAYGDAGKIRIVRSQDTNNNKYYWMIYAPIMLSTSYAANSSNIYESDYAFCVSVYPTSSSSSTIVDMWENSYCWFGQDLSISGSYNYCKGNDECSVSDNACYSKVISVGAYVTKNSITDYNGTAHDASDSYPNIGDHAYFSSWQTAGYGPTGTALPTINAPGARIVAGVNHYHTASVDDYSYYGSDYSADLVVNSTTYPYAAMEGTSMATPCVSGIIAQWLQACVEAGKTPTPDYIKEVMAATWDTDEWTNGTGSGAHGAKTFGTHGKINAIKGIQYILGTSAGPTITATPKEVAFEGYVGDTYTEKVNVKGVNLTGNITASISGDKAYSIDKTSITKTAAADGVDITITWKPTATGETSAVLTLKSTDAEDVSVNITGKAVVPELIADPTALTLTAEAGLTATGKFSVLGADLKGNVTATLNDPNGVFSLSATSITKADAEDGKDINVTFAPTAVGSYTATVTLSTDGVDDIYVTLNGTATAPVPALTADKQSLTFTSDLSSSQSQTFTLSGRALSGDATIKLTDANGVFTVSPTTVSAADIIAGNVTITVTFQSAEEGDFAGKLTISSPGVDDITISLSATASDGGTASDSYLNIAKYKTIDEAGWRTALVNNLYKYTEYEEDGVAWLTLPVYGAFVGAKFSTTSSTINSGNPQKWIESNINSTSSQGPNGSPYSGTTWSATDVYQGSSEYFTSTTSRAIGSNSRNGTTTRTVTFYVTNTTAVKLYGKHANSSSSSYPTALYIYECTVNADGTLTASTTATKSATYNTSNGTANLSATNLDASKVYKVVASQARGYLYEIAFQTPLPTPVIEADAETIEFNTRVGTPVTESITIKGTHLKGEVTATLEDENNVYSIDPTSISIADAQASQVISVTFDPAAAGNYTATVTLSSEGAESVTVSLSGTATLLYDINRDGQITIADVTALVNIILGKATRENDSEKYDFDAADVNGDGSTTIADVTALVNIILGK